jgi:membrane associated rhomboid family serine protease
MFLPYADDAPNEGKIPWLNWLLILTNVLIYFQLANDPSYERIVYTYGFTPSEFRPVTLLTSMFLHGDIMHLLGNMWFLHLFGDNVENRCGKIKYLLAYVLTGLAGALSHYMFFPHSEVPSIGASGAIFGVMGMYLFFFPTNRVKVFYFVFIFIGVASIRAIWVIGLWAGMEIFYSQMQRQSGVESGIGHLAHSGGFVAGALIAAAYSMLGLVHDDRRNIFAHMTGRVPSTRESHDLEDNAAVAQYRMIREPGETRVSDPRHTILALLHAGRIDEARRAWRRYAFDNQTGVLPVREQLEVALELDKHGERGIARDAYERLLKAYPNEQPYAAEANLALAGMLLQELKETGDQRELPLIHRLLTSAAKNHPHASRRDVALRWLRTVEES